MSTVYTFPLDGVDLKNPDHIAKIDRVVEGKVKAIIDKLKVSHQKFEDPDFGPTEDDELGAKSLYGNATPAPSGSKYPPPDSLRWDRPHYDDDKFGLLETKAAASKAEGEEGEDEEEGGDYDDEFGGGGGDGDDDDNQVGIFLDDAVLAHFRFFVKYTHDTTRHTHTYTHTHTTHTTRHTRHTTHTHTHTHTRTHTHTSGLVQARQALSRRLWLW